MNENNDKPITPIVFKKPIKNRNLRKVNKEEDNNESKDIGGCDNGEDKVEEENTLSELLELTKEKQKLREKGKGVNVGVLAEGPHVKHTFRELENKLDDSFTVHQDKQDVNIYLEKYVNEQLEIKKQQIQQQQQLEQQRKLKNNNNNNGEEGVSDNSGNNEDSNDMTKQQNNSSIKQESLFETPEHLKGQQKKQEEKTNWVAGIAEVQLPDTFKFKNIVETEKAKDALDKQPKNYEKLSTPQNFNQNYQYHNRHVNNKKQKNEDKATDNETMENFKKRFRY